jgi:serine/threonine protein phosphatase 1
LQPLIKKLPANTQGTDYVVGDLHGCFKLLERLLADVQFDKANDRLFSVGDLADRGPDCVLCPKILLVYGILSAGWHY